MPIGRAYPHGLFLGVLAISLLRCNGTAGDADAGSPTACGATPHGEKEQRTCYAAASVPFGETCVATVQSRTCSDGGWNPDFAEPCPSTTCAVAPSPDCGATLNGHMEVRTCFSADIAPFGSTCMATQQSRTCVGGVWSPDWPACAHPSCEVAPPAACDGQPHGTVENRNCFATDVAPFGTTCTATAQSRTCVNGLWSPDWPACASLSCVVAPPAACDGQPHGTVETRTCFDAPSALYGQQCTGTVQSRTCNNGSWTAYPSCTYPSCYVEQGARCGNILHGAYESRPCYGSAAVPFATECTFTWQDRLCDNGAWAPDYGTCPNLSCTVGGPPDTSAEHGWLVQGTSCTPSIDEREYAAVAIWGTALYAAWRGDSSYFLHSLNATSGGGLTSDRGYGTGGSGLVVDATGVYSAGEINGTSYVEKRDLTTLAHIAGFGSFQPGVRKELDGAILRLEGRDQQLWMVVERPTAQGYEWILRKLTGVDGSTDPSFGNSGSAATGVLRAFSASRPKLDLAVGSAHLYLAYRVSATEVRVEKHDLSTGALVSGFGSGGGLSVIAPPQSPTAPVSVFEHLGRLYLASGDTVFQLNSTRGNTVWQYAAGSPVFDLIADETGVYVDDRFKLGHDGVRLWTSTAFAARSPSLAVSGHWLYVAGSYPYTQPICTNMRYRELVGRLSRYDGLLHP